MPVEQVHLPHFRVFSGIGQREVKNHFLTSVTVCIRLYFIAFALACISTGMGVLGQSQLAQYASQRSVLDLSCFHCFFHATGIRGRGDCGEES